MASRVVDRAMGKLAYAKGTVQAELVQQLVKNRVLLEDLTDKTLRGIERLRAISAPREPLLRDYLNAIQPWDTNGLDLQDYLKDFVATVNGCLGAALDAQGHVQLYGANSVLFTGRRVLWAGAVIWDREVDQEFDRWIIDPTFETRVRQAFKAAGAAYVGLVFSPVQRNKTYLHGYRVTARFPYDLTSILQLVFPPEKVQELAGYPSAARVALAAQRKEPTTRYSVGGMKFDELEDAMRQGRKTHRARDIMVQELDEDGEGWTNVGLYRVPKDDDGRGQYEFFEREE